MTIEEKFTRAHTGKIIYIIVAIAVVVVMTVIAFISDENYRKGAFVVDGILAVSFLVIGLIVYTGYGKSIKYVNKWNMYHLVKDIDIKQITFKKSKIVCGQYAFYAVKQKLIIPYKPITWIYVTVNKAYGFIEVSRMVNFKCIDGETFTITMNQQELDALIPIIAKNAPNLILGYGGKQIEVYNGLKNQYLEGEKARRNMQNMR